MSIGDNIRLWREMRNLKQSELAELIGVSDKTVSSWEINRTEPKMGMVEKICSALKCKKTDIIGVDPSIDSVVTFKNNDGSEISVDIETVRLTQKILEEDSVLLEVYKSNARDRLMIYANKLKSVIDMENDM